MKYKWILPLFAVAITSCNEETIDSYGLDEAKIYFQQTNYTNADGSEGYSTSTKFSFMGKDPEVWKEVVFKAPVKLMGAQANRDRFCKVVVDEENTTMVEGRDYEIDLDTLKIKAGKSQGEIGVRFLRSKAFREQELTLTLKLEPNDQFSVLEVYKSSNSWTNTTAEEIDGSRYTFTIDEVYTYPPGWTRYQADKYFGSWTIPKYNYINAFFGFTNDDWGPFETGKISLGRMPFYARELQKELQRRFDEGDPVMDEDENGNEIYMQLPAPYEVDFSTQVEP